MRASWWKARAEGGRSLPQGLAALPGWVLLISGCLSDPGPPAERFGWWLGDVPLGVELRTRRPLEGGAAEVVRDRRYAFSVDGGHFEVGGRSVTVIEADGALRSWAWTGGGPAREAHQDGDLFVMTAADGTIESWPGVHPVLVELHPDPGSLAGQPVVVFDAAAWKLRPVVPDPGPAMDLGGLRVVREPGGAWRFGALRSALVDEAFDPSPVDPAALLGVDLLGVLPSHKGRLAVSLEAPGEEPVDLVSLVTLRAEIPADLPVAAAPGSDGLAASEGISVGGRFEEIVRRELSGVDDRAEAVDRLIRVVQGRLTAAPVAGGADALAAWIGGQGDCTEHSALFASLARTAGIPTRTVVGLVPGWGGHRLVLHAWVEVELGPAGWVGADPLVGAFPIPSTYFRLPDQDQGSGGWARVVGRQARVVTEP